MAALSNRKDTEPPGWGGTPTMETVSASDDGGVPVTEDAGVQPGGTDGTGLADDAFTDDELTALALAAETDAPLDEAAIPLGVYLSGLPGPLPQWYMPPAITRGVKKWRAPVVLAVIAAFLIIDAFGLCSTYGPLVFA